MKIWNNVLKFECQYQQNGILDDSYKWSGYIKRVSLHDDTLYAKGMVSTIEGTIVDEQVKEVMITEICPYKQYRKEYIDKRYLLGEAGLIHPKDTLNFVIFPVKGRPIDYEFLYDEETDCLYGVWYFVTKGSKNTEYGGFARLVINQNIEVDEYEIDKDIIGSDAYCKHSETIGKAISHGMSNLQSHEGANSKRFVDAKEYFIKIDRVKGAEIEAGTSRSRR